MLSKNIRQSRNVFWQNNGELKSLPFLDSSDSFLRKITVFSVYRDRNFVRGYCSGKNGREDSNVWTDEIDYLDESGSVIYSGKGIRSVEAGIDDHVMAGGIRKPIMNVSAVAKIVEVVKRWRWGPDMESQLDKLQFVPNMTHITQALKIIEDSDAVLSLFRWAKRQSWYLPNDESYVMLFDKLNLSRDFEGIQSIFEEMVSDSSANEISSFGAYNRVLQYLAKSEKLEVTFCCFKKIQELECKLDTRTYNALITLFLTKGLPYKAFEIYANMEKEGCSLDASTYDLMIPTLAKSGRLDTAFKLFQEMKTKNYRPTSGIFASLVDTMGKAGRLDTAMKVYMELQGFGLRPSGAMFVSLIESFVKAGKLDAALRLWDEMKNSGLRPNYGLYTMIVEAHAKSGKLEIAMSIFTDMEKAGFLPTPSTYSSLLEMHAASG